MAKTKNKIIAILLCLTMIVSSLFILSACGKGKKTNPNRIVKDDFTLSEKLTTYQTMLTKMCNLESVGFSATMEKTDSTSTIKSTGFCNMTKTKSYSRQNEDGGYTEQWDEVQDGDRTIYTHKYQSSKHSYSKETYGLAEDYEGLIKEEFLFSIFFSEHIDEYNDMTQYADGRKVLEVKYFEEESYQYSVTYEINKNGYVTKLSLTEAYEDTTEKYEVEFNYKDEIIIPIRPTDVQWNSGE